MADLAPSGTTGANPAKDARHQRLILDSLELAILATEEERDRIGAELHSGVAQDLTALIFKLNEYQNVCPDPASQLALSGILKQVDQILESVRRVSSRSAPPLLSEISFASAMGWLADYATRHRGMACQCEVSADTAPLSFKQSQLMFRWARWLVDQINAQSAKIHVRSNLSDVLLMMEFLGIPEIQTANIESSNPLFVISERVNHAGGHVAARYVPNCLKIDIGLPICEKRIPATILFCDENAGVRDVSSSALASHGYVVLAAENSEAAINISRHSSNPVHMLITDASLPGRLLFETLRVKWPELKVIYMSTPSEVDSTGRGDNQIIKPFAPRDLIRTIQEAFAESR